MTMRSETEIDTLGAPADDGGMLVWPDADALLRLAEENRRLRGSYRFEMLQRPAGDWVGMAAARGPVIMTGHQPLFFHPGVWAKHVAASALAVRLGGQAEFLVVDSDALHTFALRWPADGADRCRLRSAMPFHNAGDRSYEQLPRLPSERWRSLFAEASAASQAMPETAWATYVDGFMQPVRAVDEATDDYVTRWAGGMRTVDRLLDIQPPQFKRVSEFFSCRSVGSSPRSERAGHSLISRPRSERVEQSDDGQMCVCPPAKAGGSCRGKVGGSCGRALGFVAHLLLNAEAFAAAYNEALAAYRARRGIRGRRHPIPDLAVDGDRVELPLWLLHDHEPRRRLAVSSVGRDGIRVWAGAEPICLLPRRDLRSDAAVVLSKEPGGWEIRPRALALLMYVRLFVCDLFIHGVGGAKYDQITDGVIRRFFGVEPPAFACVSATLRLPLSIYDVSEADRLSCRRRVRDVQFNPQRYVGSDAASSEIAALREKRERAIADSVRLRRAEPRNRADRRAAFERIRRANVTLLQAAPDMLQRMRRELVNVSGQLEHNRFAQSREWFFAFHPLERLRALAEALRCYR